MLPVSGCKGRAAVLACAYDRLVWYFGLSRTQPEEVYCEAVLCRRKSVPPEVDR